MIDQKKLFLNIWRLSVILFLLSWGAAQAQVSDIDYQKLANENRKKLPISFWEGMGSTFFQPQFSGWNRQIQPLWTAPLLERRFMVQVNNGFKEKLTLSVLDRFQSKAFEIHSSAQFQTIPSLEKIAERLQFTVSNIYETERAWKVHLRKADFEALADELSLSEINRYQFRKNRQVGKIPVDRVPNSGEPLK